MEISKESGENSKYKQANFLKRWFAEIGWDWLRLAEIGWDWLNLIGWEDGAGFLDQSHSEFIAFDTQLKVAQYLILQWPVGYGGGGGKGGKITIGSKCLRFGGVCFGCGLGFNHLHPFRNTNGFRRAVKKTLTKNWIELASVDCEGGYILFVASYKGNWS